MQGQNLYPLSYANLRETIRDHSRGLADSEKFEDLNTAFKRLVGKEAEKHIADAAAAMKKEKKSPLQEKLATLTENLVELRTKLGTLNGKLRVLQTK